MPLVELRNLHKRFGRLVVLNGVSLDIHEGQSVVVIGASGTGKSVLLKHIVGLLRPDRGEVWFDGRRVDEMRERDLVAVRKQFGFLFQMGALFDSLTVEENIAFPVVEHTRMPTAEVAHVVEEKLRLVGLPGVGKKMPAELSGGQRKRVALARAIAMGPRVILYDEPTTGLDPITANAINRLIRSLQRRLGITSIVVTHDIQSAFQVADRVAFLHEGRILFEGTVQEAQSSQEQLLREFLSGGTDA
jgi:phospholipid/cholesterol/gamma-HCH transport system ATP-binding protein